MNNNRTRMVSQVARNAARVPHSHDQRIVRNNRYWCRCGYAWPRSIFYTNGKFTFSEDSAFKNPTVLDRAADIINNASINNTPDNPQKMTVPQLIEIVRRNHPNLKGVSKMRKPELISILASK